VKDLRQLVTRRGFSHQISDKKFDRIKKIDYNDVIFH